MRFQGFGVPGSGDIRGLVAGFDICARRMRESKREQEVKEQGGTLSA